MWLRKRNLHTHTHKQFSTHETKQKTKTKNQIPTLDYSNSLQRPVLPNMRLIRVCQTMLLLQLPDLCQLLPRSVRPKLTKASCLPRPCPQLWIEFRHLSVSEYLLLSSPPPQIVSILPLSWRTCLWRSPRCEWATRWRRSRWAPLDPMSSLRPTFPKFLKKKNKNKNNVLNSER